MTTRYLFYNQVQPILSGRNSCQYSQWPYKISTVQRSVPSPINHSPARRVGPRLIYEISQCILWAYYECQISFWVRFSFTYICARVVPDQRFSPTRSRHEQRNWMPPTSHSFSDVPARVDTLHRTIATNANPARKHRAPCCCVHHDGSHFLSVDSY
jgi:hypothetical protein